jgi:hypothetical protein
MCPANLKRIRPKMSECFYQALARTRARDHEIMKSECVIMKST